MKTIRPDINDRIYDGKGHDRIMCRNYHSEPPPSTQHGNTPAATLGQFSQQ